jgi:serine/threonine protein kinase
MSSFTSPIELTVDRDNYCVVDYVQEGGLGTVYSGVRISDGNMVALKFFGYTKRRPREVEIQQEINLLWRLKGVPGIVQIEGVFSDTAEG